MVDSLLNSDACLFAGGIVFVEFSKVFVVQMFLILMKRFS